MNTQSAMLSNAIPGKTPPAAFRLFKAGWNDTSKGRFLFDAKAASAVMAAYRKQGVDVMIDLEHQSLASDVPRDPSARDARGWGKLQLSADGSLWAVGVKWTADGIARLTGKRQRYISPAFTVDGQSRIERIVNIALVAMPATYETPALVAASARKLPNALALDALDAFARQDGRKALDVLQRILLTRAGQ
jgi:phage I-like protein